MSRKKKLRISTHTSFLSYLGFLLLIPSLLVNFYLYSIKSSDEGILVLEVLDGDTIVLDGKSRLRLRHVDAPELEYCKGEEARDALTALVKGRKIIIREQILDQRGRAMALVYVDNELVNKKIVETGLGRYHHDKTTVEDELKTLGLQAKEIRLGVYSPECYQTENLDYPECVIKGNTDQNNHDKKIYYVPGCVHYHTTIIEKDIGEQWFCTEKEARAAGYVKSSRCP